MAIGKLSIDEFLQLSGEYPVLDVRSPGEFAHAHIPGAHSLPLFSDEERKIVGTAYKQESKEKAIKLGLSFFGTKMVKMVEEVEEIVKSHPAKRGIKVKTGESKTVIVHCWRGGMRSAGVAWLLDLYGFKVYTLVGGYKVYRRWVLQQFEKEYPINILGGYTGSGKTEALHAITKKRQPAIDLEKIAGHKGSAFGNLGQLPQPSQEMFENLLARELSVVSHNYSTSPIWVEDESQRIGEVNIPTPFYKQMRSSQIYFINIPFEERLNFIVEHYGKFEKEKLMNAIMRIKKRLGGLETKTALGCLVENDIKGCFALLLLYYDKLYLKSLQGRDNFSSLFNKLELDAVSHEESAKQLLLFTKQAAI
ncbi:MAG: tRNA 2-selenouridine(34) synthase MnmH [Sediminibacterium sp.]|nr:tRNA 2-selenouridine(34) synthase MnmH [Sediminibacterium sp.]